MNQAQRQQVLEDLQRRVDPRLWQHWMGASAAAMQMGLPAGVQTSDGAVSVAGHPGQVQTVAVPVDQLRPLAAQMLQSWEQATRQRLAAALARRCPAWVARWLVALVPGWVLKMWFT